MDECRSWIVVKESSTRRCDGEERILEEKWKMLYRYEFLSSLLPQS